jgi:phosphatidate cytidylyltransferase
MPRASAALVAEGSGLNELLVRTMTGLVLIAAALIAAVMGGNLLAIFVAAIATLMFYEWTRIVRGWGAAWHVSGFFYALLPALALLWIRERTPPDLPSDERGLSLLVWVFIVTWSTDIGAYFTGRNFGKRKLAPAISPNKTVEGLLGGIVAATLLGGAWVLATGLGTPLLALAPLLAVAAQGGDLFESGMKRRAGVKDSGAWLPGHGGALDRLDGLVPVAVLTAAAQLLGLT